MSTVQLKPRIDMNPKFRCKDVRAEDKRMDVINAFNTGVLPSLAMSLSSFFCLVPILLSSITLSIFPSIFATGFRVVREVR